MMRSFRDGRGQGGKLDLLLRTQEHCFTYSDSQNCPNVLHFLIVH